MDHKGSNRQSTMGKDGSITRRFSKSKMV